ncbi:DUF4265 domain-containing protein [Nonomuraea polychroma]|uniref:DUF4265 domain-containing protein n=1 Tax=Nonomuraea polychroma TaxID=46176 RepID=UPI001F4D9A99|nr:DUF4265 domain-containing protein [Nonomuraea polychroma]
MSRFACGRPAAGAQNASPRSSQLRDPGDIYVATSGDTHLAVDKRLSRDTARVANVPFLQDGVAEGDVVRFITDEDGLHWACERAEASGNCTVRVLPVPDGPLGRSAQAVHEQLAPFGLGGGILQLGAPPGRLHRAS